MTYNPNITKKLKIAFKRWSKQCKEAGWDGFSEPFMASALFMIKISQKRQQNPDKTFDELLKIVQKENDDYFYEQQEKQLMRAKSFAEAQKLSEKETNELINNTKEKLAIELNKYQEQRNLTLKLFDYAINESGIPFETFEESKNIIESLSKIGYNAVLLYDTKIINAGTKGIGSLAKQYLNDKYDIVTSGTFLSDSIPLGTIIVSEGCNFESQLEKVANRGGIAVLNSGLLNYDLSPGNQIKQIVEKFKDSLIIEDITFKEISETDEVVEFIGGGALLISNKEKITGKELYSIQKFDQIPAISKEEIKNKKILVDENGKVIDGLYATQMRSTQHILLAKNNELDYLVFPKLSKNKSGINIQNDLFKLGFSHVLKLDGGSAFFVESNIVENCSRGSHNPSGFAFKVIEL